MAAHRSFTEYVKKRFDNNFWAAAESYLESNLDSLGVELRRIHRAGETEISDVKVEHVWVEDKLGMEIHFDVAVSIWFETHEGDYHYDDYDENIVWIMIHCRGDLDKNLDDFEILQVSKYDGKNLVRNPMDDSLVPIIPYDKLETVANEILQEYFHEALRVPMRGQAAVWVDPTVLVERMGLKIKSQRIRSDSSVFGQIYFYDTDTEMYDAETDEDAPIHIEGRTIVVDPQMYLLRNLGSINNTIIHECVHWHKHRKAFRLEQLFNETASHISCEVLGDASSGISNKSTHYMETQANQLAPRIQMPKESFSIKAKEYIAHYMRQTGAKHPVDVMEMVICSLEQDFGVSRQAAKIRLVELGFEEAIGTFTFVDGHYVKPHGFKKGSLKLNQTFTISSQDAAIERFVNLDLREKTENGDYLFVENHFVYNAPLYVQYGVDGRLELTDYARSHMDECCLVFDLSIKNKVSSEYHTICFLNREPSDITFEIKYHNGYENAPQKRQIELRKKQQAEWMEIRKQMTDDPEQCMDLLLDWRKMKYTELADAIDLSERTIRRTVSGETTPRVENAVRICFALHLPTAISEKLLEVLSCKLKPTDPNHQWIKEALYLKYSESYDAVCEWLLDYGVEL